MRVAPFQRDLLKTICDSLATFISIPAGNGKTTLMAAVALERLMRGDEYVEVDVIATKVDQAQKLITTAIRMIESSPVLSELGAQGVIEFYKDAAVLEYRPTGSRMTAHPARLSAIQGLNSTLALVDEIGMVPPELVTSMIARLGKREQQRVLAFGTPGFLPDNMLETLREMARANELPNGARFVEYAAEAGCSLEDEEQRRLANPAIEAGFLSPESMELKMALMLKQGREHEYRAYHLGQPIESSGPWLPYGAWDSCFEALPPKDGTQVVLALWGNYSRQVAIVGATLDGSLFFGWQAEKPGDDEVEQAIRAASEQWELLEICHKPHIRFNLMTKLADEGLPVTVWSTKGDADKESTSAFYQAIASQELAHDHDPTLSEQIGRLTAKIDPKGNPRLVESEAGVSAALAARAAWWRAKALVDMQSSEPLTIY